MKRISLAILFLLAAPAFGGGVLLQPPIYSAGGFPLATMYMNEVWVVSVRSTLAYAMLDFEPGDVLVETGDSNAPYLRVVQTSIVTCGGPWIPAGDSWIVEAHLTEESARARAEWFPWQSWRAKAPDGRWLLVFRNPDYKL